MASTTIPNFAHLQIPLEKVLEATNNFNDDNIIGRGGFGPAYKGRLFRSGKLMKITALRLDRRYGEGDIEFWTEISVLSDLNHPNLVSIVGFCDEKHEKVIITTYEAKGSLKEHLNSPNLTWTQRLKICIGVARALSYLHYDDGRGYGVIHLNINSSTILLDKNWEAKLSGFKASIKQPINRMDQVILSEPIGAIGYMDPAIEKTGGVTNKSDIYSFGVVLFEILSGREAYDKNKNKANRCLAQLVKYHHEKGTPLKDMIHPDIWNQMFQESLLKYSKVAYSCLEEEPTRRPNIQHIVGELEKALELQLRLENLEKNFDHLKISLNDIKSVTQNFAETHKRGADTFIVFYVARLDLVDKQNPSYIEGKNKGNHDVVIKRFLPRDDKEGEEIFFTEIEMLTSVKHRGIVTLHGFCVEGSEKILVLEDFPNGYLNYYLREVNGMHFFTWEKRLNICLDVAEALNYLHYEMEDQKVIINRDISSHNIWFDEDFRAKLVEFGCSVYLPPNQVDEALYETKPAGQPGYVDPEHLLTCKLKRESDVYSFGVVLFEILSGRFACDPIYLKESKEGLAYVARRCIREYGTLAEITDPIIKHELGKNSFILKKEWNKDSISTFLSIAYQCVAINQDERPTMKVVIQELKKAINSLEEPVPNIDQLIDQLGRIPITDQVADEDEETLKLLSTDETIRVKNMERLKIPLADIKLATDNFSKTYEIAGAYYFTLFKAELDHFDLSSQEQKNTNKHDPRRHDTVVIKRFLPRDDDQGKEVFYTTIEMLTSIKHRSIVTLLGFCIEDSEMILVTDDVSNGYLGSYLGKTSKDIPHILTWEKRLNICIDVANALHYLHYEMEDQKVIINRHIKSYNIGLDENLGAKIVEFEIAIFLPPNQEDEAMYPDRIAGNSYYIDPEYEETGKLKRESDVYSFGVVLFEILCGRLAYDAIYVKESSKGLAPIARQSFSTNTLEDMIDPAIKEEIGEKGFVLNRGPNKDSLRKYIEIAYRCLAETQDQRPTMKVVVEELQKALCFQKNSKDNPRFSLEDIKLATQNFHKDYCIGGGGFGKVYKGNLQDGDVVNTIVAKRLDTKLGQGEHEFMSELKILWEYKHENVIGLLGYCAEKDEKIILYEYASRGSLDKYLNNASLTWMKRLNICIDVASALDFIHGGVGKKAKVIHRDIKTANILLNHDWKAKLADFGLSLISPIIQETDYVIDHACGTPGYLDPLYHKLGFLTIESDIYSFGVVLFEILCGRSTYSIRKHEGHYLPDFIKNKFEEGKHDEVVFEQIRDQIEPKSLTTFQKIAFQCLHYEREKRPTTKEVLAELKKALEFQISGGD